MRPSRLPLLMIGFAVSLCVLAALIVVATEQERTLGRLRSSLEALASVQAAGAPQSPDSPSRPLAQVVYIVEGHQVYKNVDDQRTLLIRDASELEGLPENAELMSFYTHETDGESFALLAEPGTLVGPAPGGNVWKLTLKPGSPSIIDTGIPNRQWQVFVNEARAVGYGKPDAHGEVRVVYALDLDRQHEAVFASLPSDRSFTASLNDRGEPVFARGWDQVHRFFGTRYVFPVYAVGETLRRCDVYLEACTYRAPVSFRIFSEGQ